MKSGRGQGLVGPRTAGGNFIDTANLYTNGASERFVGEFIASHREEVVVATRYTNAAPGRDANAGGNQRKNMVQAVEASLQRLGTDYIDLYRLHVWDQTRARKRSAKSSRWPRKSAPPRLRSPSPGCVIVPCQ